MVGFLFHFFFLSLLLLFCFFSVYHVPGIVLSTLQFIKSCYFYFMQGETEAQRGQYPRLQLPLAHMYTLNCFAVLPATSSLVNNTKSTLKHVLHFLLCSHKSLNSYLKSPSAWLLPQILLPKHPYHCLTNLLPSTPLHPWHCLVIPGLCRHAPA